MLTIIILLKFVLLLFQVQLTAYQRIAKAPTVQYSHRASEPLETLHTQ